MIGSAQLKLISAIAALGAAALSHAQNPMEKPRQEESTPAPAPKRSRAISSDVAAQLSAALPKYTPPPPKREPTPEEQQVDLREVDKPKNTIVRLPKYVVQEPRPPVFSERAIYTKEGLADVAVRRYISEVDRALSRYTAPLFGMSAEARALAMYAEDERLQNMNDLQADAQLVGFADKGAGLYVKKEVDRTFMRTSDFGRSGSRTWQSEAGAAIRAEADRLKK